MAKNTNGKAQGPARMTVAERFAKCGGRAPKCGVKLNGFKVTLRAIPLEATLEAFQEAARLSGELKVQAPTLVVVPDAFEGKPQDTYTGTEVGEMMADAVWEATGGAIPSRPNIDPAVIS